MVRTIVTNNTMDMARAVEYVQERGYHVTKIGLVMSKYENDGDVYFIVNEKMKKKVKAYANA